MAWAPLAWSAQIQGQPTSWIYVQQNSSYDAINRDLAGAALNGLNGKNPAHLGAKFSGVYVDTLNAFGVFAWDTMTNYSNGALVNGLNLGFGYWPQTNSAYVVGVNAFPAFAWDELTNYLNGADISGLNAGNDNGSSVQWAGAYNVLCSDPATTLTYTGGVIVAAVNVLGYDTILMTFDGSNPDKNASQGAVSTIAFASWPPTGTWTYDGAFALPVNATVTAAQGHGINGFCFPTSLGAVVSFGQTWSNNVVANGGANPSSASVAALNVFGAGLNNDQLLNSSLGAFPSISCINAIAPDSLIAATTPQIYFNGSQPWVNHNFVSGDLTVNGLTGNGTSKYLDTGYIPGAAGSPMSTTSAGLVVYVYNDDATTQQSELSVAGGAFDSAFDLYVHYTSTHNFLGIWRFDAPNFIMDWTVPSPAHGYYSGQRIAASGAGALAIYFANSGAAHSALATETGLQTGTIESGRPLYAFGINNLGTAADFSKKTDSFFAITSGLTATQSSNFFNRIQTLRTSFGGGFR